MQPSDDPRRDYVPANRKERRKLAKSFKAFKPKNRDAWRIMNKHMKARHNTKVAEMAASQSIVDAIKEGDQDGRD